eukprot:PhM_4_TR18103/c0_g1_i1/m.96004
MRNMSSASNFVSDKSFPSCVLTLPSRRHFFSNVKSGSGTLELSLKKQSDEMDLFWRWKNPMNRTLGISHNWKRNRIALGSSLSTSTKLSIAITYNTFSILNLQKQMLAASFNPMNLSTSPPWSIPCSTQSCVCKGFCRRNVSLVCPHTSPPSRPSTSRTLRASRDGTSGCGRRALRRNSAHWRRNPSPGSRRFDRRRRRTGAPRLGTSTATESKHSCPPRSRRRRAISWRGARTPPGRPRRRRRRMCRGQRRGTSHGTVGRALVKVPRSTRGTHRATAVAVTPINNTPYGPRGVVLDPGDSGRKKRQG